MPLLPTLLALDVHAYAPYPTSTQKSGDADDRWYWLIWSLKRGQTWTSFDGTVTDPCDYISARLDLGYRLDASYTLIPIPSSSAFALGAPWPARRLAEAVSRRYGAPVSPLLQRDTAVQKASQANAAGVARPTVQQHIASMSMAPPLPWEPLGTVVFVDDTLTKGTQLFAALHHLRSMGYQGKVRALCAGYTLRDASEPRATNVNITVQWDHGWTYGVR